MAAAYNKLIKWNKNETLTLWGKGKWEPNIRRFMEISGRRWWEVKRRVKGGVTEEAHEWMGTNCGNYSSWSVSRMINRTVKLRRGFHVPLTNAEFAWKFDLLTSRNADKSLGAQGAEVIWSALKVYGKRMRQKKQLNIKRIKKVNEKSSKEDKRPLTKGRLRWWRGSCVNVT